MDTTSEPSWTPWIQATLGAVIGAAANKEFAPAGMQSYQTFQVDQYGRVVPNGQPVTQMQAQTNQLLIVGAVALVAFLILK